jgi:beta-phosphoglucomutase family hydrolase
MNEAKAVIAKGRVSGVVFDMDGVVTQTATVHARAWKRLFDDYLRERSERTGEPVVPFDIDDDYRLYVDGKPRYDGVHSFLLSRGIALPPGLPGDAPESETECGLGNRKNSLFLKEVEEHGVRPYETTVELIGRLKGAGIATAVISASENTTQVLEAAGVRELFEAQVDGLVARELGLPGKPDPAVFIEAARRIGAPPSRAAIVEDALAGVEAGRRGGFALVIGVDRTGHADALREHGADVVVQDLAQVDVRA